MEEIEFPHIGGGNENSRTTLKRNNYSKKVKYYQQYDLDIQLIDTHLIEMKACNHTKTFIQMFMAFFLIGSNWK